MNEIRHVIDPCWDYMEDCAVYKVIRLTVIGQHYSFDSNGYGFPELTFQAVELASLPSCREAEVYIRGAEDRLADRKILKEYDHPTSVCSMNGPGLFNLDKTCGPLLTQSDVDVEDKKAVEDVVYAQKIIRRDPTGKSEVLWVHDEDK